MQIHTKIVHMFIYKWDTHTHTHVSLGHLGNLEAGLPFFAGLPPDPGWVLQKRASDAFLLVSLQACWLGSQCFSCPYLPVSEGPGQGAVSLCSVTHV